jgi:phytoene dehydrogenase-like protein
MVDTGDPDAVVVGAGPNGLVAANLLADAGWRVVVCEEQPEPGGAVRSGPGPAEGFVADHCSAFYPMAAASPAIRSLGLEGYGLRWSQADTVLAHPLRDGRSPVLLRDVERTAHGLDELAAGDGNAWRRLHGLWQHLDPHLINALFVPFPPVNSGARLAARLGPRGLLRFARFALRPVRTLIEDEFAGPGSLLLAGCALHADLMPESAGSTVYGWLLSMLGHQYGWPAPTGGSGMLTTAMVRRLESRGGTVRCGDGVREVVVRGGRALGVRTASGHDIRARRAVLAAMAAPRLYGGLVGWEHLPAQLHADLRRFRWDYSTFKVDWSLRRPVPWKAEETSRAGTVHIAASLDEMSDYTAQLTTGRIPSRPFVLLGQMTTTDPSRSPGGTESLWGYTHVPRLVRGDAGGELTGWWDEREREAFADRIEAQVERFAPGWRELVSARRITPPAEMDAGNRTSSAAASTAVPRRSTSSSSSARPPRWGARRPRSPGCTWPPLPRIRVVPCTAPAARTRPVPRCGRRGRTHSTWAQRRPDSRSDAEAAWRSCTMRAGERTIRWLRNRCLRDRAAHVCEVCRVSEPGIHGRSARYVRGGPRMEAAEAVGEARTVTFTDRPDAARCVRCDRPVDRVAQLVTGDGGTVGSATICTRCQPPHRHRKDD